MITKKFCPKCGLEHAASPNFCRRCGAALPPAAPVQPTYVPAQPKPAIPREIFLVIAGVITMVAVGWIAIAIADENGPASPIATDALQNAKSSTLASPDPVTSAAPTAVITEKERQQAIDMIYASITHSTFRPSSFKVAPLNGGVAISANDRGAYWIKDGKLYAGNGMAKGWSAGVPYAPLEIDYNTLKQAVDQGISQTKPSPEPSRLAPDTSGNVTEKLNGWTYTVVTSIPEEKRKQICASLTVEQDKEPDDAEWSERAYGVTAAKFRLSKESVTHIIGECVAKNWPLPTTPRTR